MKKNFLALMMALFLSLSLAACGGSASAGSPESGAPEISTPESKDPEESTPESNGPEESAPQKDADLAEFYDALLSGSEWPALMALEGEALDSFYPGLSDLSLRQCLVNTAAISAAVGEIALVETETEEDAKTVQEIFQARIDYQVGDEDNPGGAWYPETIEGWRTDSHIAVQGRYVMLAVGENAAAAVESFQALFA